MPTYKEFHVDAAAGFQSTVEPPPSIGVERIQRGQAGFVGSCADLGFLVLRISDEVRGYKFEVVEGTFPGSAFPTGFIESTTRGLLGLTWVDGSSDEQEPIKVVVKVTSMSISGVLSEPVYLRVEDPGRVAVR